MTSPAAEYPPATEELPPAPTLTDSIRRLRVWIAFALLSVIWGSSYLFIRIGVRHLQPPTLVAGRLVIGWIVICIIVAVTRTDIRVSRRTLGFLVVQGSVATAIPFLLLSFGEVNVPSGLASVLNAMVPIFTILIAGLALPEEPFSTRRVLGAIVGFGGVVVLASHDPVSGGGSAFFVGEILILLSSVSYACGGVWGRLMLRGVPSTAIAFWAVGAAATETTIIAAIAARPSVGEFTGESVFAILWLGVLGSGIAYTLSYFILTSWGANRLSLVAYLMPVVGLILGVVVLSETFDWRIAVGSCLILVSVAVVSRSKLRRSNTTS